VTDIEQQTRTRYTVDTLRALKKRFPRTQFVWLMGADNLATIHRWQEWAEIFALCPILVLDRSPFSHSALRQKAALRFAQKRQPQRRLRKLSNCGLPSWGFVHIAKHPDSSTEIRARQKNLKIS
jgi:nicotinate-nucleotide adenylyltransferase